MLMFLSVSDGIPTIISKILWTEFEAEQRKTTKILLLRKHIFLKNNTFIFICLRKRQCFHSNDPSGGGLLFFITLVEVVYYFL